MLWVLADSRRCLELFRLRIHVCLEGQVSDVQRVVEAC